MIAGGRGEELGEEAPESCLQACLESCLEQLSDDDSSYDCYGRVRRGILGDRISYRSRARSASLFGPGRLDCTELVRPRLPSVSPVAVDGGSPKLSPSSAPSTLIRKNLIRRVHFTTWDRILSC